MSWDPLQYNKFEMQRWRPARDLVSALPEGFEPKRIVELGCGAGRLARLLADRFPDAEVTGIDGSSAMLAKAAAEPSRIAWVEADITRWQPEVPIDLIISNAALHWLRDHAALFPRLVGLLAPGGVLAVQMPNNFDAPSHAVPRAVAADPRWADRVGGGLLGASPVHRPDAYYDWLAPRCATVDIWETEYLQVLEGEDAVLEWLKGTALRPVMAVLTPDELRVFMDACAPGLAAAYPRRADGCTLFAFRRLFIVARRS